MKFRDKVLVGVSIVALIEACAIVPQLYVRWRHVPVHPLERLTHSNGSWPGDPSGAVPVVIGGVGDPGDKDLVRLGSCWWQGGDGSTWHAVNFRIIGGQVFAADDLIPLEQVPAYINSKLNTDVRQVMVTPVKGTKWGVIVAAVDACRKSKAQAVFLNMEKSEYP